MEKLVPTSILERESVKALRRKLDERISDPQKQRLIVLVIVSTALLLDNMLYMVIVPIMPEYLRETGTFDEQQYVWTNRSEDQGPGPSTPKAASLPQDGMLKSAMGWVARVNRDSALESQALGFLFASKALVQLCISPIAGTIMDRVGYDLPMVRLFLLLLLYSYTPIILRTHLTLYLRATPLAVCLSIRRCSGSACSSCLRASSRSATIIW